MTWLFTQVWLWSLAAFVFGSLLSWLLFALPLWRRLRALADEYANYVADVEERFDEQRGDEPQPEPSAMDLLPTEVDARPEVDVRPQVDVRPEVPSRSEADVRTDVNARPEVSSRSGADARTDVNAPVDAGVQHQGDEPTFGDWHRSPRAWMPGGSGADASGAARLQAAGSSSPELSGQSAQPLESPQPPGNRQPPQHPGTLQRETGGAVGGPVPEAPEGRETAGTPVDETELRMEEQRETPERRVNFRAEPAAPPPSAPAEPGFVPPVPPEPTELENQESRSSWFQKGAMDEPEESFAWATAFDPSEPAGTESRPENPEPGAEETGQLRSLFRPRSTPASLSRSDSEQDAPAEAAGSGAEAPAAGVAPEPSAADDVRTGADYMLPRRTPGHGPRPGRQNLNRLRKEAGAGGDEQSERARVVGGPQGTDPPAGADSPGTAQAEERAEREGKMVKGHFASRQYHTPESPQYDRIVAEVWFRSAADAEQAGFEPWNGNQNLN